MHKIFSNLKGFLNYKFNNLSNSNSYSRDYLYGCGEDKCFISGAGSGDGYGYSCGDGNGDGSQYSSSPICSHGTTNGNGMLSSETFTTEESNA
jgi:hypothetical protein